MGGTGCELPRLELNPGPALFLRSAFSQVMYTGSSMCKHMQTISSLVKRVEGVGPNEHDAILRLKK